MKSNSGVSLFELVIVMAIVAILATIAMPGFQYVTSSNRVSTEVNGLLGDMQYARNEALKEGQPITVCPSANPTSPTPSCSGSTAWQSGWIVFPDPDSTQTVGPTTAILRNQTPFTGTDTLDANLGVEAVTFNREGFASSGAIGNVSAQIGVVITLHDATANAAWTRCLLVNGAAAANSGMLGTARAGAAGTNCS
ncbi:MAG: GspH/FimT family pseudopilin [Steroidobacteraceae bacterium]